jgi:uncharacterized protein (TIGR03083 family)
MKPGLRRLGSAYEEARGRISSLVAGLDDATASTLVPACPAWSVHDLLAHLTGVCADIRAGNVKDAATDAWTAVQVEARKARTVSELLAEWSSLAPPIAALVDDFPGRSGDQLVADVTIHEHDIRGALGQPGARDAVGISVALDFLMMVYLGRDAIKLGLHGLEVLAGEHEWVVGTGGPPIGTMKAEPFELLRAITGRRSATQIRGLDWTVDPTPYLPLFGVGPFKMRTTDLNE